MENVGTVPYFTNPRYAKNDPSLLISWCNVQLELLLMVLNVFYWVKFPI